MLGALLSKVAAAFDIGTVVEGVVNSLKDLPDEQVLGKLRLLTSVNPDVVNDVLEGLKEQKDPETGLSKYDKVMRQISERLQDLSPEYKDQVSSVLQTVSDKLPAMAEDALQLGGSLFAPATVPQQETAFPQERLGQLASQAPGVVQPPADTPATQSGGAGISAAPAEAANVRDRFGNWYHVDQTGAVRRYDTRGNLGKPISGLSMAQYSDEQKEERKKYYKQRLWNEFTKTRRYRTADFDPQRINRQIDRRAEAAVQQEIKSDRAKKLQLYRTGAPGTATQRQLGQLYRSYQDAVQAGDKEGAQEIANQLGPKLQQYKEDVETMKSIGIPEWVIRSGGRFEYDQSGNAYLTNPNTGKKERVDSRIRWYLKNWEGKGRQRAQQVAKRRALKTDPRYVANLMRTYDISGTQRPAWMSEQMTSNPQFAAQVKAHYTTAETERRSPVGAPFDYDKTYQEALGQLGATTPKPAIKPPPSGIDKPAIKPPTPARKKPVVPAVQPQGA